MKNTPAFLFLLFCSLFFAVPHLDAALYFNENTNLEDIQKYSDTRKFSAEIEQGFKLSERGLHEQAFQMFTKAAERGEVTAYMALGVMHRDGEGTPKNLKLAKENFKKAADKGSDEAHNELTLLRFTSPENPEEFAAARSEIEKLADKGVSEAQLRLGLAHLVGYGYPVDASKAIGYLTQAATNTGPFQASAAFALGQLYRDGNAELELKPDGDRAESWLKVAAEKNHPDAMIALGDFYLSPDPEKQDYDLARKWFVRLEDQANPHGTYYLGLMSENGWGEEKSLEAAAAHYQKAADGKVPSAIYKLATLYETGTGGLSEDKNKAIELYRRGAELGHPLCMFNLSILLEGMDGESPPNEEVMIWLLRSAAAGLTEANFQIGLRYYHGRGVPNDFVAAAAWFDRAARSKHAEAQLLLGQMYEIGRGVERNHKAARRLFELSAKRGNFGGMLKYAEVLANGIGGEQDLPEAYRYAESATTFETEKVELAIQLRDNIVKIMSPEQLAEGKKRVSALQKD